MHMNSYMSKSSPIDIIYRLHIPKVEARQTIRKRASNSIKRLDMRREYFVYNFWTLTISERETIAYNRRSGWEQ